MTEPYPVPTGANNTPLPSRGPAKAKASKGHRQRPEPLFDNLQDLQKAARKLRLSKRELAKLPKEERLRNKRDRKALKTDRKRLRKELVKEKHRAKAQAKKSQDRKDGEPPKAVHDASMETVGAPEESVNKDAESVVKSDEAPADGVVKIIIDDKPAEKPSKVQPPHLTPKERKAERAAKRAQQKIERDARKKAKLAARAARKAERAAAKAKGEDQDKEDHDDNDDDEKYSTMAANDGDDVSIMVDDKPAKKQAKTPRRAAKEQTAATLGKNPKNKLKYDKNKERNAERKRQMKLAKTQASEPTISGSAKDAADSSAADVIPVGTTATPSTSAQAVATGGEISKKRKRENKKNEVAADAKEEKESKKAAAKEKKRAKKAETKVEQVVKAEVKKIETEDYIPL
ncbi:hypothetical protein V1504DRAFT_437278 [Lipomyces starkeyi]